MVNPYSGPERRKAERVDAAFTLTYSIEKPVTLRIQLGWEDNIDALMLDLSELGMAIVTKHDIPSTTELYMKFIIINFYSEGDKRIYHMEIVGEVVSNLRRPDGSHRLGIRFTKISDADKQAIRDFVICRKLHPF
jgi:c-di-GMP-binding flagellar brake protein YcgR